MLSIDHQQVFYVNDVLVDPVNNKLVAADSEVSAPHKLIQLLQYFAANPNRLITNQELTEKVWDGFVSEGTRYSQIANLRKLLNDRSNEPRFLKTVPRQGYIFIAEVTYPENAITDVQPKRADINIDHQSLPNDAIANDKQKKGAKWQLTFFAGVLVVLVVLVFVLTKFFKEDRRQVETGITYDYQHLLNFNRKTVLVDIHLPSGLPDEIIKHISLANMLLWHQFSDREGYQVEFAPLGNPNFIETNLYRHYESGNPVLASLSLWSDPSSPERFIFSIKDTAGVIVEEEITLNENGFSLVSASELEEKIVSHLFSHFSELKPKPAQLASLKQFELIEQLQFIRKSTTFGYDEHVKELEVLDRLSTENPQAAVFRNFLLDSYADLVQRWGGRYRLSTANNIVNTHVNRILQSNPNDKRALYTRASMACAEKKSQCSAVLSQLIEQTQDLSGFTMLSRFAYFSKELTPLDLARFDYRQKPFFGINQTFFTYFHSALEHLAFDELQSLMDEAVFWRNQDLFGLQIHSTTELERVKVFQKWYNQHIHHLLGDRETNVRDLFTSVIYISFNLLNANRPDLASQWAEFTDDRRAQLEADALAQLWKGEWKQHNWFALSTIAENNFSELTSYDKWRMAYFEFHAGLPRNALTYYEDLVPELFGAEPLVTMDNVRFAVYLAETLKGINRRDEATILVESIRAFFEGNSTLYRRSAYLGITDVQFYALNGEVQRALSLLEKAIVEEQWLPNAFWLWPPIQKDPFLWSLKKLPGFEDIKKHQLKSLENICLGEGCEQANAG